MGCPGRTGAGKLGIKVLKRKEKQREGGRERMRKSSRGSRLTVVVGPQQKAVVEAVWSLNQVIQIMSDPLMKLLGLGQLLVSSFFHQINSPSGTIITEQILDLSFVLVLLVEVFS